MSEEFDFDAAPDLYTLVDEEGNEQSFELLDVMEIDGMRYFALLPNYDDPEEILGADGEFVVLRSEIVDGEEMMVSIDDDEEYERVGELFLQNIAEMYEEAMEDAEQELQ